MTLILSVNGPDTLWVCADRRLSALGQTPIDSAIKLATVDHYNDMAILAYAGLGRTAGGTQPSEWMSNTLRGINMPIESLLGILARAVNKQMPQHLSRFPKQFQAIHTILAPAFISECAQLYAIEIRRDHNNNFATRYLRLVRPRGPAQLTPRIEAIGSGRKILQNDSRWMRPLLRLANAHDQHKIPASAVAEELAGINLRVSRQSKDKSVGPRCIVMWKYRKGGPHRGGGGHYFYTEDKRDASTHSLPCLANGIDIRAAMKITDASITIDWDGDPMISLDEDSLKRQMRSLLNHPDDTLH